MEKIISFLNSFAKYGSVAVTISKTIAVTLEQLNTNQIKPLKVITDEKE